MPNETLSPRQEAFVLALTRGEKPAEAYRQAFESSARPQSLARGARRELQKAAVQARLARLNETALAAAEGEAVAGAGEILRYFTAVLRDGGQNARDRMKAAELLAKRENLLDAPADNTIRILADEPVRRWMV